MRTALLAIFLITLAACDRAAPPNIVFIFADDHAAHAVSAYGSRLNETPNIDRLAREGMLFRNAFVTNSICAPSRAVILTGKHSHLNGVMTNRERFDSTQVTFPKLLQAAGYQTAIIGKFRGPTTTLISGQQRAS
jgi:arylsulfatase A-like enzyme